MSASGVRRALRQVMEEKGSIIRTRDGLTSGLTRIRELKDVRASVDSRGPSFLLETRGMLLVAEMVLAAALMRDESRGPHLRFNSFEDNAPIARDDARWCKYIVIRQGRLGDVPGSPRPSKARQRIIREEKLAGATVRIGRVGDAMNREAVIDKVMETLDSLLPAPQGIKRGARVVIKPNLTADTRLWQEGIVTSPYTVEGIIRYAQQAQAAEIVIAEATACGLDNKKAFRENGYEEVASRTGARIVDLYDEEFVPTPVRNGMVAKEIRVAKRVMEADFLINVPTMKTHVATGVSLMPEKPEGRPAGRRKAAVSFSRGEQICHRPQLDCKTAPVRRRRNRRDGRGRADAGHAGPPWAAPRGDRPGGDRPHRNEGHGARPVAIQVLRLREAAGPRRLE